LNGAGSGSLWTALGRIFAVVTEHAAGVHKTLTRRRAARRLRVSETLSLGEKRFLAVVQFQQQEFLVGGTGNSIALLARLDAPGVTPDGPTGNQENGL
jgi:flagellar biogenesis protein FliO